MKPFMVVSAILLVALLATFSSGCASDSPPPASQPSTPSSGMPGTPVEVDGGAYWRLSPSQFRSYISDQSVILINVDDVYSGEIAGTKLFLGAAQVADNLDQFPADKTTRIAIYCATATKTPAVATTLVQAGYTRVVELRGGLMEWIQQGYPVTNNN